jgi:two-component system sensor histidine kinase KdpD
MHPTPKARGSLGVFLGVAPGAGKTWAMLAEGKRLAAEGRDVVVGLIETHGRSATIAQLGDLEVVPHRVMSHRGTAFGEMDLGAILARHPDVVLIDELAHNNVARSPHDKRWQSVEVLLDAGIDVVTNLNVQHLDSVSDAFEQLAGITQRETVPDKVVASAGPYCGLGCKRAVCIRTTRLSSPLAATSVPIG